MTELGPLMASDNILDLSWSPDGVLLAITPSTGETLIIAEDGRVHERRPEHGLGNGKPAWFQGELVTCGFDGKIRFSVGQECAPGRGLIDRVRTSPDGLLLAAGQGKDLHVFDKSYRPTSPLPPMPSAVMDFGWNPANPSEIAVVGAGGARMWRLGGQEPYARFDWGGASLAVDWSSCGRWLVTADQTPSVHIYDFSRDYPLHIQGYEAKVLAMDFSSDGKRLATGGGPVVTVWPCVGETGPEGVTPIQLDGHDGDVIAAEFSPATDQLATGDGTGALLIFTFQAKQVLRKRVRRDAGIAALAWHPSKPVLAVGHSDGVVSLLSLEASTCTPRETR